MAMREREREMVQGRDYCWTYILSRILWGVTRVIFNALTSRATQEFRVKSIRQSIQISLWEQTKLYIYVSRYCMICVMYSQSPLEVSGRRRRKPPGEIMRHIQREILFCIRFVHMRVQDASQESNIGYWKIHMWHEFWRNLQRKCQRVLQREFHI